MITMSVDSKAVAEMLGDMKRKLPIVARNVVNDLAFEVRAQQVTLIAQVFPTAKPQTKKNIWVKKASTTFPTAAIRFDQIYQSGIEYMLANIEGGSRAMKPSEQRLGRFYVPGIGAKLDQYGNMRGGQVTQILSRLGRFGDVAGYNMNRTAGATGRMRNRSTEYFILTQQRNGLKPGVYQRTEKRGGFTALGAPSARRGMNGAWQRSGNQWTRARGIVPVMVFTKSAPQYRAAWPFFKSGQALINQRMPEIINYYVNQMTGGR